MIYFVVLVLLFLVLKFYFRLANHFDIIDKPNHRSSHSISTIRGGGILFPIAIIAWFFLYDFQYPYFVLGLILISLISFADDVKSLSNKVRSLFHLIAVSLMLYELALGLQWFYYPLLFFLIIGVINAYNFMDGINGLTGSYSLAVLITLWYVNEYMTSFTSDSLLVFLIISAIIFSFFNFRRKAICFAGDVGSISMAFAVSFLLGQLIIFTQNFYYIFILLVYGLDTVSTILLRLKRKENIFEAHRSHFYQYLVNLKKWAHIKVSLLYTVIQLVLNILLFLFLDNNRGLYSVAYTTFISLALVLLVIFLRISIEGKQIFRVQK